jgi:site-specific recombinase XerD
MYKYYDKIDELIDGMIQEYAISSNSKEFYKGRINNFFENYMTNEVNESRPLDAITYYDVEKYLEIIESSNAEKLNIYYALKRFFLHTYRNGLTKYFIHDVKKPNVINEEIEYISEEDYIQIKDFLFNSENDIREKLLVGLFMFTGLGRMFIYNIFTDDFIFDNGVYKLKVWRAEEEVILPLKMELQLIIHDFLSTLESNEVFRVVDVSENYLSTRVKKISQRITGNGYTPTDYSSTFIHKSLKNGNHIWEVSRLTLESTITIEKHIIKDMGLESRQLSVLSSFL